MTRGRLPWLHGLVTNWILTDPNFIVPDYESKELKNYQMHSEMHYGYLFGGRLRFVKQKPRSLAVALVILTAEVLFWVFEADFLWHHVSPAAVIISTYFFFLTSMFFVKASTCDPGIMPRNLHLPCHAESMANGPDEYFNTISLPYFSDKKQGVAVKYCPTCHIWRLPRMSHCAVCNSCVQHHDHHCVFLNNCIGYRNYRYFLWFLLTAVLSTVLLTTLSFVHVYFFRLQPAVYPSISTFSESISTHPVAFLLAVFGCIAFVYPTMLLLFHIFLTANNFTTREYLNYVRPLLDLDLYVNVYDTKSIWRNLWLNWIAVPQGISYIRPRDMYVPGDVTLENVAPLRSYEH